MSVGASRATRLYDAGGADNSMSGILRSPDMGAATISDIGAGMGLPVPLPNGTLLIFVSVTSIKTSAGNESYVLKLYGGEVTGVSPVLIGSFPIAQRGSYTVAFDTDAIRGLNFTAPALFIGHELAGTLPSLDYHAWVVQESAR